METYSAGYLEQIQKMRDILVRLRDKFPEKNYPNVATIRADELYSGLKSELPSVQTALEIIIDARPLTFNEERYVHQHRGDD